MYTQPPPQPQNSSSVLGARSRKDGQVVGGIPIYVVVAVGSSGILKGKQKLGATFNSNKLDGIDFTKFSKLTMCSA